MIDPRMEDIPGSQGRIDKINREKAYLEDSLFWLRLGVILSAVTAAVALSLSAVALVIH